jgi:hypothetical protein
MSGGLTAHPARPAGYVARAFRRGRVPRVVLAEDDVGGRPRCRRGDARALHRGGQQAGTPGVVRVRLAGGPAGIPRVRDLLAGHRVHLAVRLPAREDR